MTIRYKIRHRTIYDYSHPVSVSHHSAFLRPRTLDDQTCVEFALKTDPGPSELSEQRDYFGNSWIFFSVLEDHLRLSVTVNSRVDMSKEVPDPRSSEVTVGDAGRTLVPGTEQMETAPFRFPSPRAPGLSEVAQFARPFFDPGRPLGEAVLDLTRSIHEGFEFDSTATEENTPLEVFFRMRRGVCQDFSHLMLSCLRAFQIPARYVSGYILTDPPPGQDRLEGADASHAWVGVYIPDLGWVDFDPTNGLICDNRHVTVAWGRDYGDVGMLKGAVLGGGEQSLKVEVTVKPEDSSHLTSCHEAR